MAALQVSFLLALWPDDTAAQMGQSCMVALPFEWQSLASILTGLVSDAPEWASFSIPVGFILAAACWFEADGLVVPLKESLKIRNWRVLTTLALFGTSMIMTGLSTFSISCMVSAKIAGYFLLVGTPVALFIVLNSLIRHHLASRKARTR